MTDWAGFGAMPRPHLAPGAASALNSALNAIEATTKVDASVTGTSTALVAGTFVGPHRGTEPHEVHMRCAGCRTNYGRMTMYASGTIEVFCTRSNCKRRTVIHVGAERGGR